MNLFQFKNHEKHKFTLQNCPSSRNEIEIIPKKSNRFMKQPQLQEKDEKKDFFVVNKKKY